MTQDAEHDLSASDKRWISHFYLRESQAFAARPGVPPCSRARILSMIKHLAPLAYKAIVEAQPPPAVRIIRQPDSGEVIQVADAE